MLYASARKLFALNTNGKERWERAGDGTAWSAPAVGDDGILYTGYSDAKVYALDALTGQTKWEFATDDGLICFPALGANAALFFQCEGDSKVYALNRQTGRPLWTALQDPTPGPVRPALASGKKK
jgi:outer membrane protein assembly factor BamB